MPAATYIPCPSSSAARQLEEVLPESCPSCAKDNWDEIAHTWVCESSPGFCSDECAASYADYARDMDQEWSELYAHDFADTASLIKEANENCPRCYASEKLCLHLA